MHRENGIRTAQSLNQEISTRLDGLNAHRQRWYKRLLSKRYRGRTIRYSLLVANAALLIVVIAFVAQKPQTNNTANLAISAQSADDTIANPLDELSSADIAVHVARAARLPEATNVTNLADSVSAQLAVVSSGEVIAVKPQIIATGLASRHDIKTYITQEGDTISKIADKFGVTSNSVRWSNDINGNSVQAGRTLYIPPVDGIVYKVLATDSINGIASKYGANKEKLIVVNDLEGGRLPVGQRIIIPDGKPPSAVTPSTSSTYVSGGLAFGLNPIYGYNGYDPGWCTWYAANQVSVPTNWGNANSWDEGARASGWTVSSIPRVGAIAQTNVGWAGHVGVVEAVSADGKMIKYSDMNGLAGFGRVGYSDWVPANAKYENFIYR